MRPKSVQAKIDAICAQIQSFLQQLKDTNAYNEDYTRYMETFNELLNKETITDIYRNRKLVEWTHYQTSYIYAWIQRLKRSEQFEITAGDYTTQKFAEDLEEFVLAPAFERGEGFHEFGWTRLQK